VRSLCASAISSGLLQRSSLYDDNLPLVCPTSAVIEALYLPGSRLSQRPSSPASGPGKTSQNQGYRSEPQPPANLADCNNVNQASERESCRHRSRKGLCNPCEGIRDIIKASNHDTDTCSLFRCYASAPQYHVSWGFEIAG
jgi:hypothetical protein